MGKTMKEVAFFVAEKISTIEQVQHTNTHFVLKTYKEDGVILQEQEKVDRLIVSP
jgi:DNA-binding Lrp family transcriptional regulator